jgi:hypothetical protein
MIAGRITLFGTAAVMIVFAVAWWASAQHHREQGREVMTRTEAPATIRITMEELPAQGGVPRGWKFLMAGHGDRAQPPVSGHEKMEMR